MSNTTLQQRLEELGITDEMCRACQLPSCDEPEELCDAGEDLFGRPQKMTPATLAAWQAMTADALTNDIELKLVSAFRSIEYQCDLIQQKLNDGRSIEDILAVNAIPGFSEHHTGRALDLHAGDDKPLETSFDESTAFAWLEENAHRFGFRMSYPKNNVFGIDYEPWHWCFEETEI